MKTLVIHPFDHSTDFLCAIYEGLDCTVLRKGNPNKAYVRKLIKTHDRIIMLGHGTENGLFRVPIRYSLDLLMDSKHVQLLRQKKDCIFIWCYASSFVEKYGLSGFATGMFVSEVDEALTYCIPFEPKQIHESNKCFAESVKKNLHLPTQQLFEAVTGEYGKLDSRVAMYNHSLLMCQ